MFVAAVALAAATALVGFPNPPREAEAAERVEGGDPIFADLLSYDALSLGEGTGSRVVGLTVLPPRPGPVDLRVQVVGVEAGDGLGDASITARGPGGEHDTVRLRGCGLGCFNARTTLTKAGPWTFDVAIRAVGGDLTAHYEAPLPTPSGTAALERALAAMERLTSAAMDEHLQGRVGGPEIVANYRFSAPDSFSIHVPPRDQVVIGDRSYDRPDPSQPWTQSPWPGRPFQWPRNYLREFWHDPVAVRLLGTEQLNGEPVTIVSFVRPDLPAWFRVAIDGDGQIRRQEMRAEGHLMDHLYREFNTSPPITTPDPSG